ncbi:MAG: Gx transporter family protein [Ruminococcaceae bacterium]|nr:Gx transporter family protein [Oscillospiraceae bacterium]
MFRTDGLKKLIFLSLCLVFSLALSFLEGLIPLSGTLPGVKIGISNIVILAVIYIYSPKEGIALAFLKSVLLTLLSGNGSSFFYSLSGGLLSAAVMGLARSCKTLSPIGVSMLGGVSHILGQLTCAFFMLGSYTVFYYYPFLSAAAIISGFINGYLVKLLLERLERRV